MTTSGHSNHNYSCVLEGMFIGAAMGAVAGILFAPRAEKTIKKAGDLYSNVHGKTGKAFEQAAKSAGTKLGGIKDMLGRA